MKFSVSLCTIAILAGPVLGSYVTDFKSEEASTAASIKELINNINNKPRAGVDQTEVIVQQYQLVQNDTETMTKTVSHPSDTFLGDSDEAIVKAALQDLGQNVDNLFYNTANVADSFSAADAKQVQNAANSYYTVILEFYNAASDFAPVLILDIFELIGDTTIANSNMNLQFESAGL